MKQCILKKINIPPVDSHRAKKPPQKSIKSFIKKEKDEVAVKQRRRVLLDKQGVCKNMGLTEYNHSRRDYTTFTELQVSSAEIYKTKVVP